ncbi:MAG: leucine--tRNA ligase [Elusimicrobiaceae bacterium]|nr:leucine--tRNA ligase [Elusimicrobiaceae bacterium]
MTIQTTNSDLFRQLDKLQQKRWADANLFKTPASPAAGKKFYCLDMFPYPSGAGLHVGHPEGYTASDIITRYKRMNGYTVLHPMGWDAFGLPAENYAIQTGIHPDITTRKNIDTYRRQIKSIGLCYDWDREINTTDPEYFKWTQWIFLQLFKRGLAYESTIPINWCPSCKTGLANEEVFGGKCERCGSAIEEKDMRQWMLKITAYGPQLLEGLEGLDWPESTMHMQKNWIGRSDGAEVSFQVSGRNEKITVFTTRPDTLYGATYMVLAPEHPLVPQLLTPQQAAQAQAYIKAAGEATEYQRTDISKEKTGVFTGSFAVNPLNGRKIPVWISDYVLIGYGTGAIMAVPAHDERDHEFAKKFGLEITEVVQPEGAAEPGCFTGEGIAVNSGILDGLKTPDAKKKIIAHLEKEGSGKARTTYRLRDWVFSRQRYWGEPIPIVHCGKCGPVAVPESELPLRLPDMEQFEPSGTGESPLALAHGWLDTVCPECGGTAKRETNTMPQWAGSCWYYLRYIDPKNTGRICAPDLEKAWLPVDCYIGGAEHAVLHLLYARFWHKVLFDAGLVSTPEPFKKLRHQGMILAYSYRDGRGAYHSVDEVDFSDPQSPRLRATGETLSPMVEKMSKSKHNVINPDSVIAEHGADAFRMYEMFMGPFDASKPWDVHGMEGVVRFLKRVWYWTQELRLDSAAALPDELETLLHKTIAKVTADIEEMRFNTAISAMMIYFNDLQKFKTVPPAHAESLLKLLHPFAPHVTDAAWQHLGHSTFLLNERWPVYESARLVENEREIGVQVNGKLRDRIRLPVNIAREDAEKAVLAAGRIRRHLEGKTLVKVIYVPGRMVSIVVK